jgi:hypothetical protein
MRRIMLLVTVGLIMATMVVAALAGPVFAQAETDTIKETHPVSTATENPCNGEIVRITGEQTTVSHFTANDNTLVGVNISRTELSGTGDETGAEYKVLFRGSSASTLGPVGTTQTSVTRAQIMGAPDAPNFSVYFIVHTTVNANGEVTSEFSFSDLKCTG